MSDKVLNNSAVFYKTLEDDYMKNRLYKASPYISLRICIWFYNMKIYDFGDKFAIFKNHKYSD